MAVVLDPREQVFAGLRAVQLRQGSRRCRAEERWRDGGRYLTAGRFDQSGPQAGCRHRLIFRYGERPVPALRKADPQGHFDGSAGEGLAVAGAAFLAQFVAVQGRRHHQRLFAQATAVEGGDQALEEGVRVGGVEAIEGAESFAGGGRVEAVVLEICGGQPLRQVGRERSVELLFQPGSMDVGAAGRVEVDPQEGRSSL
ncbi:MAG: hypothetical protein AAF481_14050 [Acidobacteriota bacterium]